MDFVARQVSVWVQSLFNFRVRSLSSRILLICRYVRGATAAEYAANLRNVYTVHTIQVPWIILSEKVD